MVYEIFKERCPTEQSKIEAGVSLVSPDPKMIVILAMGDGRTCSDLYKILVYLSEDKFPITKKAVQSYLDGLNNVVEREYEKKSTTYGLTDFGKDFGKPICMLGIKTVNELWKKRNEYGNYCSMWKIIGQGNKPSSTSRGRAYSIAKVVEYLIKNPGYHTNEDIVKNLEINEAVISNLLNELGNRNIIDHESPYRDEKGKPTRGWSKYIVKEHIGPEDRPRNSTGYPIFSREKWSKILEYLNKKLGEEINRRELANEFEISPNTASMILTYLEKRGKVENSGIKGAKKLSEACANELTEIIYYEFFKPTIEAVINLDSEIEEIKICKKYYQKNPNEYRAHLQNVLYIYNEERTRIGKKGGKEIREAILEVLKKSEEPMKASHIYEEVLKKIHRNIKKDAVLYHLKKLKDAEIIESRGIGYYNFIK